MENALSLDGGQTTLIAITVALTVLGLVGLALAMFWRTRWRIKYRLEFIFIIGLILLIVGVFPALMWIKASFASLYLAITDEGSDDGSDEVEPAVLETVE